MYLPALVTLALACPADTSVASAQQAESREDGRTHLAEPHAERTRISDVQRGQHVRLSGTIVRVIDRDEFRLSDDSGSIPVHLPWGGPSLVDIGDAVIVEGIVDDDMTFGLARPEVYATTIFLPGGTTMTFAGDDPGPSAAASDGPPGEVPDAAASRPPVAIASLARGQAATITGRVVHILDTDEFRLEDNSGSVRVYIGWQNHMPVTVGATVRVMGVLDDDPWPLRPEFYASAVTLEDGQTVNLRGAAQEDARPASPAAIDASVPAVRPETRTLIQDLQPYDIVLVEGVVDRITDEDEFRIRDDSGSVTVYIGWRNQMPVRQGERVSVIGIVDGGLLRPLREVYAYQLIKANGHVVELQADRVSAHNATARPAADAPTSGPVVDTPLTSIADVRRGQSVALRGEVTRIRDTDEFVLRDDSGTIEVYIGWRNRMPVRTGDLVTVLGTADDDVFPGRRPDIYANRIVLADGRVVTLLRGGYSDYDD